MQYAIGSVWFRASNVQSFNPYVYANNSPYVYSDPNELRPSMSMNPDDDLSAEDKDEYWDGVNEDYPDKYGNGPDGGRGSFKAGGREFDGAIGKRWYEAKSGNYWRDHTQIGKGFNKFKADMRARQKIANQNGATYELHSNTKIPKHVKDYLDKKVFFILNIKGEKNVCLFIN